MRVVLILLRVVVLLLAIGGGAISAMSAYALWEKQPNQKATLEKTRRILAATETVVRTMASSNNPLERALADDSRRKMQELPRLQSAAIDEVKREGRLWPFFAAGAVIALLGGVLSMLGYTTSGGVLLLLTYTAPFLLNLDNPESSRVLIILSSLPAAGLLSLFVSLLAFVTRPKPGAALDRDAEEEAPPRRGTKRKAAEEEEEERESRVKPAGKRPSDFEEDEEPPSKPPAQRQPAIAEDEEPERPAKKPSSKRKPAFEDEEDEPPAKKPGPKRKRD